MWQDFIEKVVAWLKDQLASSNANGFVLGLSGGLDSAVCAGLIKKATDNALCLILPIESAIADLDDASLVGSLIGIKTQYIDLTSVYQHLIKLLPDNSIIARANLKPRLRMLVLYYYANLNNLLVCGTGNKTELSLGYFTKHGDAGCDLLPIGDLYKTEVRELARALQIPEKIIKKIPSAGLWEGQTDEGEIGFLYDEIDKTLKEIAQGRVEAEIGRRLSEMQKKGEHKRRAPLIFKYR